MKKGRGQISYGYGKLLKVKNYEDQRDKRRATNKRSWWKIVLQDLHHMGAGGSVKESRREQGH